MQYIDQEILKQQQKIDSLSPLAYVKLLDKIEEQESNYKRKYEALHSLVMGLENNFSAIPQIVNRLNKLEQAPCMVEWINKTEKRLNKIEAANETNADSIGCVDTAYDEACDKIEKRLDEMTQSKDENLDKIICNINALEKRLNYFVEDKHMNKRLDILTLSLEGIITRLEAKEAEVTRLGNNEKGYMLSCNDLLHRLEALETQQNMIQLHRVSKLEFEKRWNEGMPAEQFEKLKSQVDDISKWESKNYNRIDHLEAMNETICGSLREIEKEYHNFYNQTGELSLEKESRIANLENFQKDVHKNFRLSDEVNYSLNEKYKKLFKCSDERHVFYSQELSKIDERIKAFIDTAQGLHQRQEDINEDIIEDVGELQSKFNKLEGVSGYNKVNKSSMNDALIAIQDKFEGDLNLQMGAFLADTQKTLVRIDKLERQGTDINLRKFHDAMDLHFEKFNDRLNSLSSESGDHCKALDVLEDKIGKLSVMFNEAFDQWKTQPSNYDTVLVNKFNQLLTEFNTLKAQYNEQHQYKAGLI